MPHLSLADFLDQLDQAQDLARLEVEVSELELAEIARRLAASAGPALLLPRLGRQGFAAVAGSLASEARLCSILGVESLPALADRMAEVAQQSIPRTWLDRLKPTADLPVTDKFRSRSVKQAACQQVVRLGRDIDLASLPALRSWPEETHSLLSGQVVWFDATAHRAAMTAARVAVVDDHRLALLNDGQDELLAAVNGAGAAGERMRLALCLGGPPIVQLAASLPVLPHVDALTLAGWLAGGPVDVVKCRSCELEVPAETDVVLEAQLEPQSSAAITAAGQLTGCYLTAQNAPVLQVSTLTHRSSPVVPLAVSGAASESRLVCHVAEELLRPLVHAAVPEAVRFHLPAWGGLDRFVLVSIRKTQTRQAQQTAAAIWGLPMMRRSKYVIVLDADVDLADQSQVMQRLATAVHPGRDVFFHAGATDAIDHAAPTPGLGHSLGIDATSKLPGEHPLPWPKRLAAADDVLDQVTRRWKEYGLL